MSVLGITFDCDQDKLRDIKQLTLNEFLKSYSYITVEDYFATAKVLLSKRTRNYWIKILIKSLALQDIAISTDAKVFFIEYAKNINDFELLIEEYINEQISLFSLMNEQTMSQFYSKAKNNHNNQDY